MSIPSISPTSIAIYKSEKCWLACQYHNHQREKSRVGYYVSGMECKVDGGNKLISCYRNVYNKRIFDKRCIEEVAWTSNIVQKMKVSIAN